MVKLSTSSGAIAVSVTVCDILSLVRTHFAVKLKRGKRRRGRGKWKYLYTNPVAQVEVQIKVTPRIRPSSITCQTHRLRDWKLLRFALLVYQTVSFQPELRERGGRVGSDPGRRFCGEPRRRGLSRGTLRWVIRCWFEGC